MRLPTKIEWTDVTWNPVKGCSRVSEGCRNCYAERIAARFSRGPEMDGKLATALNDLPFTGFAIMTPSGARWTGRVELDESKLELPLHWRKPRRIFVNSMSDLFHERLPLGDQVRVVRHMLCAPQHEYIILTKRAASMEERIPQIIESICGPDYPMPDCITLGVSAEDQPTADERITHLLRTPAARRIVSLEPLLGPVELRMIDMDGDTLDALTGEITAKESGCICGDGPSLDGVIVGGESGPGARPCNVQWIRDIVRQCKEAGVACFVKQLGANRHWPYSHPEDIAPINHPKGGDPDEWSADLRVREWPCP